MKIKVKTYYRIHLINNRVFKMESRNDHDFLVRLASFRPSGDFSDIVRVDRAKHKDPTFKTVWSRK